MGLDDGVMIKDNHIAAAGGIEAAVSQVRGRIPYPVTVEVETENLGTGERGDRAQSRHHHARQYVCRDDERSGGSDSGDGTKH